MSDVAGALSVAADIGGTFTDIVFSRPDGILDRRKVPTTPDNPARAIVDGVLAYCTEQGFDPACIAEVAHATTVATNAILERRGVRAALITTDGFRDVLELRRIRVPLSYDLTWEKPAPLVGRALRFTVRERLDARGNVLIPLEDADIDSVLDAIATEHVEAVAVCLLHSYRRADHELRIGAALRARFPEMHVSLSHEVLPEILEFERTSTTVVNAYVGPLIARYLASLRATLAEHAVLAPILVMQSNGGLISAASAAERPVTIIESGPAAGVVSAARLAAASGYTDLITLDMGGTTTKASIIESGEILRANEYEVGAEVSVSSRLVKGGGYLLRMPVIDISEVGAGGGSIAHLDAGGALRVGPRSAGADPGPVCYGRGNTQPTVTDANLVLGYLDAESLAGGTLKVDRAAAERAVQQLIAIPSGLSVPDAAYGITQIANSNMVRAIKSVSVERGRNPADFAIMAFGGAGPLHAAEVARALGISRVLIPPSPGVFSAFGLVQAAIEHHAARTVLVSTATADCAALQYTLDAMRADVLTRMRAEDIPDEQVCFSISTDLRYRGQSFDISVPLAGATIDAAAIDVAERAFEREFARSYGHLGPRREFELVTLRLVASADRAHASGTAWADPPGGRAWPDRECYFGPTLGMQRSRVVARADLVGGLVNGPAIVQEYDTTIVVPPGWRASLDASGIIVLEHSP